MRISVNVLRATRTSEVKLAQSEERPDLPKDKKDNKRENLLSAKQVVTELLAQPSASLIFAIF